MYVSGVQSSQSGVHRAVHIQGQYSQTCFPDQIVGSASYRRNQLIMLLCQICLGAEETHRVQRGQRFLDLDIVTALKACWTAPFGLCWSEWSSTYPKCKWLALNFDASVAWSKEDWEHTLECEMVGLAMR